jgi:hypothetical protein
VEDSLQGSDVSGLCLIDCVALSTFLPVSFLFCERFLTSLLIFLRSDAGDFSTEGASTVQGDGVVSFSSATSASSRFSDLLDLSLNGRQEETSALGDDCIEARGGNVAAEGAVAVGTPIAAIASLFKSRETEAMCVADKTVGISTLHANPISLTGPSPDGFRQGAGADGTCMTLCFLSVVTGPNVERSDDPRSLLYSTSCPPASETME